MSLINTQVQPFKAKAFHNGQFIDVTEASLKGKGPWKKRLPQLLETLVALGRARRVGDAFGSAA